MKKSGQLHRGEDSGRDGREEEEEKEKEEGRRRRVKSGSMSCSWNSFID